MCLPLAAIGVASAVVSGISAIAAFQGQNQAAQSNLEAANVGYMAKSNDLNEQASEIDRQQSENTASATIERAKQAGAISASASSFGTGPQSTAAAEDASATGANRALAIQNINSESQRLQAASEGTGAILARQSQINQVQKGNPLSLALGLASAGFTGADQYSKLGGHF